MAGSIYHRRPLHVTKRAEIGRPASQIESKWDRRLHRAAHCLNSAFIFPTLGGEQLDDYQNEWRRIQKPSAIDDLLPDKPIGELTADEYLVLARKAQTALHERKLAKLTHRRFVA